MSKNRHVPAILTTAILASTLLLAACPKPEEPKPEDPKPEPVTKFGHVVFVKGLSPDAIEQQHPLTDAGRAALTPDNVRTLAQWEIDQLYARLTAGAIPDGPWRGQFFFAEGGGPAKLADALGPLTNRLVNLKLDKINRLGEAVWQGKVFYKEEGVLRNMIDKEELIEDLFDAVPETVTKGEFDGREVDLLFPAKLYCGESLYDPRRESVIIDYAETETVEGYVEEIDRLAGREGLEIRDEIRIVKPGFYLGRAYSKGKMLLTFTLANAAASAGEMPEEECWDGSGPRPEDGENG